MIRALLRAIYKLPKGKIYRGEILQPRTNRKRGASKPWRAWSGAHKRAPR